MSTRFTVPIFNQSTSGKVHNRLTVSGRNTVSRRDNFFMSFYSAIATESIPATVDGEYVFAVRIDNMGESGDIMIGVTPTETSDADKNAWPGHQGMSGSALNLFNGNYMPGGSANLVDRKIANGAKEVIVVVTISPGRFYGHYCFVKWIVDGTSMNRDCTADCNGNELFPLVIMFGAHCQITTIPIDQVTIRNDEINKLIENFSKQPPTNQGAAVASNDEQEQQLFAAAFAQLQQELEKQMKRADSAELQVQNQSSEITQLKQQLLILQSQLNNRY